MAAPGDLESEKGDVVGLEDFEGKLNERRPAEDESDSDLSTGETTDSEAGMYLTHFVQVSKAGAILHKPREGEQNKAWCGTTGKSPARILVDEVLGRKTSFCARCFGTSKRCSKICSHTKMVEIGGESTTVRCARRCDLGCLELGKYLDEDARLHLCAAHLDSAGGEDAAGGP